MIISCPACETQFNVDALKLAPSGRKVRCAKCVHIWRVGPDGLEVAEEPPASAAEAEAPPAKADLPEESVLQETATGELEPASSELPEVDEEAAAAEDFAEDGGAEEAADEEAADEDAAAEESADENQDAGEKSVLLAGGEKSEGNGGQSSDAEKTALANLAATQKALKNRKKPKGGLTRVLFLLLLLLLAVLGALALANSRGLISLSSLGSAGARATAEIGVVTAEKPKPAEGGHILESAE